MLRDIVLEENEPVRVKQDQSHFWPILRFYNIWIEQMLRNFASVRLRYYISAKLFNFERFVLNFTNL